MLDLTKQEKQAIVFLMASTLLGIAILCYKNLAYQPKIEIISNRQIDKEARESRVININTAAENELMRLKGIGPALAKAIIEYRTTRGLFKDKEGLKNIKGIGQAKYEEIKDRIKIE